MNIYLVRKIASYKEDLFGAFASKKKAIQNAQALAKTEKGAYHTFDVVSLPLTSLRAFEINPAKNCFYSKVTVFTISK